MRAARGYNVPSPDTHVTNEALPPHNVSWSGALYRGMGKAKYEQGIGRTKQMEKRVYNFSAGPANLPLPVLEAAQRDLLALPGVGASVLEISHRSPACSDIFETAETNLRKLLGVPDSYKVLFLQGGASLQFSMAAINFLRGSGKSADYILTGSWGKKAIKEAKREGSVNVAWDGGDDNYKRIPSLCELKLDANAAYVHMTSNETIQGVQFPPAPEVGNAPVICDMSSDILCRPLPVDRYGMIYAGAQKNMGPSGVTLVILSDELLGRIGGDIHSMLDYRVQAENKSLYNTPPVFGVYVMMLVTKWLLDEIGGLDKMEAINRKKSEMLYEVIDNSGGFYQGHAIPDCRSIMNVTWRMESDELNAAFIKEAKTLDLDSLKGHRSVGGMRASIYNAMPVKGVETLRDFMIDFQKRNG